MVNRSTLKERIEAFKTTMSSGGVKAVSAPQLFVTPADLAARMVREADLQPGMNVLEPSAGTGALIKAMWGHGVNIYAVEINWDLAVILRAMRAAGDIADFRHADFLECDELVPGAFDRVLMNPPFAAGSDIRHIRHAEGMLTRGGLLVALCADGPRQQREFQDRAVSYEPLPSGTFREAGTMVNVALVILKRD